jgi:hypothetical protein
VLACIVVFSAPKVRKIRTCRENLWTIQQAQKEYFMERGMPAADIADLIPRHLKKVPVCPSEGSYSISNPSHGSLFGNFPTCSSQNPRHKFYLGCGTRGRLEEFLLPVSDFILDATE